MGCKIIGISNAAYSVANNISSTLKLIRDNVPQDEQLKAISEITLRASAIAIMLAGAAVNHYSNHSTVDTAKSECSGRVVAAGLPILVAIAGLGAGMSVVLLLARVTTISSTAPMVAVMVGLGVGIDYALLLVARVRDGLRAGHDVQRAVAEATERAGRPSASGCLSAISSVYASL